MKNNKKLYDFFNVFGGIMNVVITIVIVYVCYKTFFDYYNIGKNINGTVDGNTVYYTLEVPEDTTIEAVTDELVENGIIPNRYFYKIENILLDNDKTEVYAGTYELNSSMNNNEIASMFRDKINYSSEITITIKEGFTNDDIGTYLESKGIITKEEFLNELETGYFDYAFVQEIPMRDNRFEGYLFPETYNIAENATAHDIINKLLGQFEKVYFSGYDQTAIEQGLSMDDVIKMASIIEKEVVVQDEQAKVSAVIRNRLEQDIPLQMCSTVQYVLDVRKDRILLSDLEIDSPYNTYKNKGLPYGPIANPGEAAISAVLNPVDADYLYFVLKNDGSQTHVFTSDYNEFLAAKEQYNQIY